jgi:hypothetical protein
MISPTTSYILLLWQMLIILQHDTQMHAMAVLTLTLTEKWIQRSSLT